MNWDQVEGKWTEYKGRARQKWGKLTEDDIEQARGNREELEGRIQNRYGSSKEAAKKEVDEWLNEL